MYRVIFFSKCLIFHLQILYFYEVMNQCQLYPIMDTGKPFIQLRTSNKHVLDIEQSSIELNFFPIKLLTSVHYIFSYPYRTCPIGIQNCYKNIRVDSLYLDRCLTFGKKMGTQSWSIYTLVHPLDCKVYPMSVISVNGYSMNRYPKLVQIYFHLFIILYRISIFCNVNGWYLLDPQITYNFFSI